MSEQPQENILPPQASIESWLHAVDATSAYPQLQVIAQGHLERARSNAEISPEHHQAHIEEVEAAAPGLVTNETPPDLVDEMGAILEVGDEAIQAAETVDDYETINRQELAKAFNSYTFDRARGWGMRELNRRAPIQEMRKYRENLPAEADQSAIDQEVNSMTDNHNLLESISDETGQNIIKPAMTICVPVATLKENPSRIANLLESIKKQQVDFSAPLQVILWTNAKFTSEDEAQVRDESTQKYEQLKNIISESSTDKRLQIKTALQVVPEQEFSMSKMRGDYMEALAVEAKERGYGFDHPVMWLDADTTDIKHGSLKAIADEVQSFKSLFSHPITYYAIDWNDRRPITDANDATRAFAIDEMARRMAVRSRAGNVKGKVDSNPHRFRLDGDYFEESGCSFALGTYLKSGGIVETTPINETTGLLASTHSIYNKEFLPEALLSQKGVDRRRIDLTIDISNARIYVSGRNHYEGLKRTGRLSNKRGNSSLGSGEYMLFSDLPGTIIEATDVDVERLLTNARANAALGNNPDSNQAASNLKTVDRITDKYFEDKPQENNV